MIWFKCKQCGRDHSKGDNLAGTMVFCECGQGNLVPWSSTIPEPEVEEAVPLPVAMPPEPPRPVPRAAAPGPGAPYPAPARDRPQRRVSPDYCFNHEEQAAHQPCDSCRLPFCAACLVTLQDRALCSPCKNFVLRGLTRPVRTSALAIVSLVVGMISGPVTFCLTMAPLTAWLQGEGSAVLTVLLSVIGVLLPGAACVLAHLALREIDTRPNLGGRSLAFTGGVAGLVGVLWSITVGLLVLSKQGGA